MMTSWWPIPYRHKRLRSINKNACFIFLTNPAQKNNKPAAMYSWNLENERIEAENYLRLRRSDFTATYMQVANLQYIISQQPHIVGPDTISALCSVLECSKHDSQRQVFFLFKKAADALADIVRRVSEQNTAKAARYALSDILASHKGHRFRAVAEAMGALPLSINGPDPDNFIIPEPEIKPIHEIASIADQRALQTANWMGRSAVIKDEKNPGQLIVIKFARQGQKLSELATETFWVQYLAKIDLPEPFKFKIPRSASLLGNTVYRIRSCNISAPADAGIDSHGHAIVYKTEQDYFCYPNHPVDDKMINKSECRKILARNAGTLGYLASMGIIHTAPIPLFHNRVQRHRRNDQGLYEWKRAGRLDQWLASCRFPNISRSGIRDFEHFMLHDGPARKLYEHLGTHVLSLVLVAGSYCRNHDEKKTGIDETGHPVDARDLFDRGWLARVLVDIFKNYYQGFTHMAFDARLPFDPDFLSTRLIEEMGVDKHMEEILRIAEQQAMSEEDFKEFLAQRGMARQDISKAKKGRQDIHILTGPHLGGFNQAISVPELIEYTAALSALCIMDSYWKQKFQPEPSEFNAAFLHTGHTRACV
jgi:hypothetical protein